MGLSIEEVMLDRLYHVFHCSVIGGFGHAERASFMLSASFLMYGFSLFFFFLAVTRPDALNPWILPGIFIGVGIAAIYGTSRYFVGTGRYRRIIDKYGSPRSISRKTRFVYRFISIFLFFFGSFAAFIASGIMLSRHLHPW